MDIKCYPSLSALPEIPELAIIATGAEIVPDIVEECGKTGIKAVIIISSGFKEVRRKRTRPRIKNYRVCQEIRHADYGSELSWYYPSQFRA